jgi:hypothetical protein
MYLDQLRHIPKIGDQCHLHAAGAKREPDRIGSIVWNRKRMYLNVADAKPLPSVNRFDATQALAQPVRQRPMQRFHSLLGDIQRGLPHAQHLWQTIAMIAMFVGNQDPVEVLDVFFNGRKPSQRFAFA